MGNQRNFQIHSLMPVPHCCRNVLPYGVAGGLPCEALSPLTLKTSSGSRVSIARPELLWLLKRLLHRPLAPTDLILVFEDDALWTPLGISHFSLFPQAEPLSTGQSQPCLQS